MSVLRARACARVLGGKATWMEMESYEGVNVNIKTTNNQQAKKRRTSSSQAIFESKQAKKQLHVWWWIWEARRKCDKYQCNSNGKEENASTWQIHQEGKRRGKTLALFFLLKQMIYIMLITE